LQLQIAYYQFFLLCPRSAILVQLAAQLNWPPEDGLVRLENFKEPWQRALCR
jgi:hypothetical protein